MNKIMTRCATLAFAAVPAVAPAGPVAAPRPYVSSPPAQLQQAYDAYRHPFQQATPQATPQGVPPQPVSQEDPALPGESRESYCLTSAAKVGDVVKSAGNTATVRSLNTGANVCRNTPEPVAAELDYQDAYSPKLQFALPKSYEMRTPDDLQRFRGEIFWAHDVDKHIYLHAGARPRHQGDSAEAYARDIAASIARLLYDVKSGEVEHLTVNGIPALRFEIQGRANSGRQPLTYVETVLDSPVELVLVGALTPSERVVDNRPLMLQLAEAAHGIDAPAAAPDAPRGPPASTLAAEGGVKPSGSPTP